MNASDQSESASKSASVDFDCEVQRALRRQGLSEVTRDSYARAVRTLEGWLDVPLDQVGVSQLKDYFSALIESHWNTVRVDRCGLKFFHAHVLEREWDWVEIVRPAREQRIRYVLSRAELVRLLPRARFP